MVEEREAAPHTIVVFGALGDLVLHKLIPSIYRLHQRNGLGPHSVLLGVDTDGTVDDDAYRDYVSAALPEKDDAFRAWCRTCIHYQPLMESEQGYERLGHRMGLLEQEHDLTGNRVYYLAVPLNAVDSIVSGLSRWGLLQSGGWTRLVLEKPFGYDLETAQELNNLLHHHLREEQIFRIDHYLGKETVQNVLALRFANTLFEHLWNREHIESVELTAAETVGVGSRAPFYERSGALRDMIQNHLTQVMTLIGMEAPESLEEQSVRRSKQEFLRQVKPANPEGVVFGQYEGGVVAGDSVVGYVQEEGVKPESRTPTYAAVRLQVDNARWAGVPFFLRTGKRLYCRHTHIAIRFHSVETSAFRPFERTCGSQPNLLLITLQPDEGFDIRFQVKEPGAGYHLSTQRFKFRYDDAFGPLADAYETLLRDIVLGDRSHFVCDSEVEAAWRIYQPLLEQTIVPHRYAAGSWGPSEADALGASWIDPMAFHP